MTYIPDTTEKFIKDYSGNVKQPKTLNGYYQDLLDDKGKESLNDMNYVKDIAENFFNNLDVYAEDFEEVFGEIDGFDEDLINLGSDEENDFSKMMSTIKECLIDWIESEINQTVVGMIESMDEKEHIDNYNKLAEAEGCPKWED